MTLRINGTTTNDENLRPKHENNGSKFIKFSTGGESLQHLIDLLLSSQVARKDRERIPESVQCPWQLGTSRASSQVPRGEGFVIVAKIHSNPDIPEEASLATPSGLKVSKDHTLSTSAMLFTGFWSWHGQRLRMLRMDEWLSMNGFRWHSFLGHWKSDVIVTELMDWWMGLIGRIALQHLIHTSATLLVS